MDYLSIDPKTSGQFSYHLKLLVTSQLILKKEEKYKISPLGVKACSMLDLVDKSEKKETIVHKISYSFKNITPFDQVIISFEVFTFILFFVPITYLVKDYSLLGVLFLPIITGLILFGLVTYYSYSKLRYIPSLLILSSLIWIIFLQANQLKTGFNYMASIFGIIFLLESITLSGSSNYILRDLFIGISCLFLSIVTSLYIIYKEYWKNALNSKILRQ